MIEVAAYLLSPAAPIWLRPARCRHPGSYSEFQGALSVALLVTLVASVPGAELEIPRLDGSTIQAHVDLPATSPHPFCVVIQGSTCTGAAELRDSFRSAATSLGAGMIVLEKYGLPSRDRNCPPEYLRNNAIHQRILDHLLLVSHLRRNRRGWDGRIVWAGGSEGGIVAALLSPLVPETRATVLLASGGGMTMADELKLLERRELERQRAGKKKMEEKKGPWRAPSPGSTTTRPLSSTGGVRRIPTSGGHPSCASSPCELSSRSRPLSTSCTAGGTHRPPSRAPI